MLTKEDIGRKVAYTHTGRGSVIEVLEVKGGLFLGQEWPLGSKKPCKPIHYSNNNDWKVAPDPEAISDPKPELIEKEEPEELTEPVSPEMEAKILRLAKSKWTPLELSQKLKLEVSNVELILRRHQDQENTLLKSSKKSFYIFDATHLNP